jgi:hypothetical protein
MSPTIPAPQLLDDWVELAELARQVKRHPRTVKRWTQGPDGLSYVMLGKTPIFHIPSAQRWLLGRLRKPNPRRSAS